MFEDAQSSAGFLLLMSVQLWERLMKSLMGAWGFDFSRWLQLSYSSISIHPKVGLQLSLSTGNRFHPTPVCIVKPHLQPKGIHSPLKCKGKHFEGNLGSCRMLQSLGQNGQHEELWELRTQRRTSNQGSFTHINPAAQETLQWGMKHLSVCFFKVQENLHCRATPEMKNSYSAHVPSNSPFKNRCCVIELPPQFPDSFDWLQTEQNRTARERQRQ